MRNFIAGIMFTTGIYMIGKSAYELGQQAERKKIIKACNEITKRAEKLYKECTKTTKESE